MSRARKDRSRARRGTRTGLGEPTNIASARAHAIAIEAMEAIAWKPGSPSKPLVLLVMDEQSARGVKTLADPRSEALPRLRAGGADQVVVMFSPADFFTRSEPVYGKAFVNDARAAFERCRASCGPGLVTVGVWVVLRTDQARMFVFNVAPLTAVATN